MPSPRCARCSKEVYFAEQQLANGKVYHKACYRCESCGRSLSSATCTPHGDALYCKVCYQKNWGPSGFRSGGTVNPENGSNPPPAAVRMTNGHGGPESGVVTGTNGHHAPPAPQSWIPRPGSEPGVNPPMLGASGRRPSKPWYEPDMCSRCGERVYHAERMLGAEKKWHRKCFTCNLCSKSLESTTVTERSGEIYCRACYGKQFGPKGYGFGLGAGALQCAKQGADDGDQPPQ